MHTGGLGASSRGHGARTRNYEVQSTAKVTKHEKQQSMLYHMSHNTHNHSPVENELENTTAYSYYERFNTSHLITNLYSCIQCITFFLVVFFLSSVGCIFKR
jgi:hypothetical protein